MEGTLFLESLGFAAGLIGLVAWIPQVFEVWYHKRHQGVSLPTLREFKPSTSILCEL